MALRRLASSVLSSSHTGRNCYAYSQALSIQTSSAVSRELTEGTPTTRHTQIGFLGKLKQGVTSLVTRQQDTTELTQEQGVDREKSPEGHPFPEERKGSIYTKAQWQDGGVVHDLKPHGQGICVNPQHQAAMAAEKDLASA